MNVLDLSVNNTHLNVFFHAGVLKRTSPYRFYQGKTIQQEINSVGQLVVRGKTSSRQQLLLGVSVGGTPFFIDALENEINPVLVECANGCGKTHQLQVIVDSALQIGQKKPVNIVVITQNPNEWNDLIERAQTKKQSLKTFAWIDPMTKEVINQLTESCDVWQKVGYKKNHTMLILDDLDRLLELDTDAQVNLRWLLEYGSQAQLWAAASLNIDVSAEFDFWTKAFKTTIVGCSGRVSSSHPQRGMIMCGLEPGEFSLRLGNRWLNYQLPLLGK